MKIHNVRNTSKLMANLNIQENEAKFDQCSQYIVKNAKKAIELGESLNKEENNELIRSMENILQIYDETYGVIYKLETIKKSGIKRLDISNLFNNN